MSGVAADDSHLDADKIDGNDGFLQRGQVGLVQRLPHHHFGRHVDEVHADCLGHKGEGAGRSQVALDNLNGATKARIETQKVSSAHGEEHLHIMAFKPRA